MLTFMLSYGNGVVHLQVKVRLHWLAIFGNKNMIMYRNLLVFLYHLEDSSSSVTRVDRSVLLMRRGVPFVLHSLTLDL